MMSKKDADEIPKVFQPVGTKVYLKFELLTKKSGLELPDDIKTQDRMSPFLEVLDVGPDVKKCKKGDTVLLGKNFNMNFDLVTKDTIITEEGFILAIVK